MTEKAFFSSKFKRQQTSNNSLLYTFYSCYRQDDITYNEVPFLAVDGSELCMNETDQLNEIKPYTNTIFTELPEETKNPEICKKVYEKWISDCSGAFVKSPTLEQCLGNNECLWDSSAPVATVNHSEEDSVWILQWIPTKIQVCMPKFQIYWAPCYKTLRTRIPDLEDAMQNTHLDNTLNERIEVQNPEKIYTIHPTTRQNDKMVQNEWLQEISDLSIPYSELPTLRLDPNFEQQKEKYRRRVRDARIRSKLAKYRAERLAQRYEERFGVYPEEDEEEAQTEAEKTEEE